MKIYMRLPSSGRPKPVVRVPLGTVSKGRPTRPDTKTGALEENLRRQIAEGHFKPGDRLPSLTEMKEQFGLSRITVEKVHLELEREGLIVRHQGSGTFVAEPVRRMKSGLIGFVGGGWEETARFPYWVHLLEGLNDGASEGGCRIVLLDKTSPDGWEQVDGVVLADVSAADWLRFVPPHLPRVSLLYPMAGTPCVGTDDFSGGRAATEHLLSLGHRRIAFLQVVGAQVVRRRIHGYLAALEDAGLTPLKEWIATPHEGMPSQPDFMALAEETTRMWLENGWHDEGFTAIVAQNDQTAIGAIRALRGAGLNVPDDVSVTGCDGTEMFDVFEPRLTTVLVPLREAGQAAARLCWQWPTRPKWRRRACYYQ